MEKEVKMTHKGRRLFITGIPTSGKSYLAKRLAESIGGVAVLLDDLRESLCDDEKYKKWVNFYLDQNEKEYLTKTSNEDMWKNLVAQSEAIWPAFLNKINYYRDEVRPVIFECVNILPHLAKKNLDFDGVVLLGSSYEETLQRNIADPRWGNTLELQTLEAREFFFAERPRYRSEAEKYGYPVFETADEAFDILHKSFN
ncbi:hypothetical protein EPO17_01210 [Patescibacteria group bacterium]|nr:MAG: hypothetical protein EPO17_01210 [Patescibacteria group bacterium]